MAPYMTHDFVHEFYVVLTNVSGEPQPVWETWNSWGSNTVSFELTTPDGQKILISKGIESFTKNFPSTFLVQPGEHYVFVIHLDPRWEAHPGLRKADEMSIKLKAIYEVTPTSESKEYRVWTGRIESRTYSFTLWQQ